MTDTIPATVKAHLPLRLGMENGRNVSIIYQGDDAICSVYGIALHRSLDELTGRDAAGLAWGQFIVRACNSHHLLTEALRAARDELRFGGNCQALEMVEAALSQAGGE